MVTNKANVMSCLIDIFRPHFQVNVHASARVRKPARARQRMHANPHVHKPVRWHAGKMDLQKVLQWSVLHCMYT